LDGLAYVQTEEESEPAKEEGQATQTPFVVIVTSTVVPATQTGKPTTTPPHTATEINEREKAQVVEIVDGDTIKVIMNGSKYSVRYIGIDTPELQYNEWFGKEARDANVELVAGKEVLMEKDVSETDQYNRLLRYVYLIDGTFVNAELIRLGFAEAKAYPPDTKYHDQLESLEQEARKASLGLWMETPTPDDSIVLPGNSSVNIIDVDKRAEYVDIQNIGSQNVSIEGWTLRSDRGNQDCGLRGTLAPGEVLRIWALAEDSDQEGYNCWFGSNIWNNSEPDPAVLFDESFNEIDRYP
jgi:micrococcal nuclease